MGPYEMGAAARQPSAGTVPAPGAAPDPAAATRRLVCALRDPACFPHPVTAVELIETHISYVLLAGEFAYKIKKPLDLGFLNYTTLAARRRYCNEELRLNSRTAPELYLDVIDITGSPDAPVLGGSGDPIEYAVRMHAFPQAALLDQVAGRGDLTIEHVEALAGVIAGFHLQACRVPPEARLGTGEAILEPALQNLLQLGELDAAAGERDRLAALAAWTEGEYRSRAKVFVQRRRDEYVRECHGDLHLGNIALMSGRPLLFDAIEFSPELRWIDVMSDVAFVYMDLLDRDLDAHAWRFLNGWLEATGDYEGLAVLRFYAVYRAMVRAKVTCLRSDQRAAVSGAREACATRFRRYLELAERLSRVPPVLLGIMSGLSGSGKSSVAMAIADRIGAIRLRSDMERKRLVGLGAGDRSGSAPGQGIYTAAQNRRTYDRLLALAGSVLDAGYTAIVDATFLRRRDRAAFSALAAGCHMPFRIIFCTAPMDCLRRRVARRQQQGARDASEATLEVLERQSDACESPGSDEQPAVIMIDTASGAALPEVAVEKVAAACASAGRDVND